MYILKLRWKKKGFLKSITFLFLDISKLGGFRKNLLFKKVSNSQNTRKIVKLFQLFETHKFGTFKVWEVFKHMTTWIHLFHKIYLSLPKIPKLCKFEQFFYIFKTVIQHTLLPLGSRTSLELRSIIHLHSVASLLPTLTCKTSCPSSSIHS
jgi:hypothetical protein